MVGEQLHQFDFRLAWYVLDNLRAHMGHAGFATHVEEQVDPHIVAYLKALEGDVEPPALLLNDAELEDLSVTFHVGPFEFDHPWIVHEWVHRSNIACAAEIRDALAPQYAAEWARRSAQFAERLEANRVNLHDGIEIVAEWVREVRRLMRAMGATDLLPAPEGALPTPTNPEPTATGSQPADQEVTGKEMNPGRQPALDSSIELSAVLERLAVALEQHAASGASSAQPAPEALSKEDAARFIGVDLPAIEYLIRTRKLEYVQYGSQRGRVIPVASLRKFLDENRQVTAEELFKKRPR